MQFYKKVAQYANGTSSEPKTINILSSKRKRTPTPTNEQRKNGGANVSGMNTFGTVNL